MKNYEIKSATADLSLGQKIVVSGKRLAYLVPNMFNKVRSGYKKVAILPAIAEREIKNVATNVQNSIANSEAIQTAMNQAQAINQDLVAKKMENYEEKKEQKEEAIANVQANENINEQQKSYIIKAYESDIKRLQEKQLRLSGSPRRLLISTVFIGKLITNRRNKKVADVPKAEPNINQVDMNVQTEQVNQNGVDTIEQAKQKYLQLDEMRLSYVDKVKAIQKEMTDLVAKFGLTREMFEDTPKITR